ncbi:glycoside hydrolase family 72 protein [Russula dissimulans]|nr:glycoside hydrolase family 72 protein [Russula dissimulans]
MFSFSRVAAAFAVALTLSSEVFGIGQITRTGRYLFAADGTRWFIKGVAYQPQGVSSVGNGPFSEAITFIDPLANATACARDLPYLTALGVNTIRVYSVDATQNHDSCMTALSGAGIYVIIDLTLPVNGSIDRDAPTWTTNLQDSYINTVDAFLKYDNILAYNIGNEIVTSVNETVDAPFIKAAARDIKAYLTSKSSTALVGYSAINGDDSLILTLANYLSCDPSGNNSGGTAIDIYGLNDYNFCGADTFADAYAGTTGDFAGYDVVAYFSEYGCNTVYPRPWDDVPALFGTDAAPVWSGGIAFSYFPATSDAGQFGIVNISADGSTVTTSTDYNNLKTQYGAVTFVNVPTKASAPAATYPACPGQNASFVGSTKLPPTPSDAACKCLEAGLSCQFAPQTSNTTAIVGSLLDTACGLLGGSGCNDLSGNGSTGTYGLISACDPSTKLSYAMSLYYEANKKSAQACSFGGNGTVNKSPSSASASSLASSCLASATGTSVPSAPTAGNNAGSTSTSSSGSSSSGNSKPGAATSVLVSDSRALLGVFLMVAVSVAGGFLSLAY